MISREITAPQEFGSYPRPWVFLCGSIEMGTAENWQQVVVKKLPNVTILNPRRDNWDSSWVQAIDNPQFREQVEWELLAQEQADLVLVHFEPNTKSPITLLELGLFHHKAIVHCPEGYWRKGNVDLVCCRYGVRMVSSIEDMVKLAKRILKIRGNDAPGNS